MGFLKKAKKKDDTETKDPEKQPGSDSDSGSEPTQDDFIKAGLSETQAQILKDQTGYPNEAKATMFSAYR
ncbi:hypothetical protein KC334_g22571, partial [Hortaea werneckii]